jgi:hypothetical protein
MEVFQRQQDLARVKLCLPQGELLPLDVKHEVSSRNVLHDKVDSSLGLEARVQVEEERMASFGGGEEDSFLGFGAGGFGREGKKEEEGGSRISWVRSRKRKPRREE